MTSEELAKTLASRLRGAGLVPRVRRTGKLHTLEVEGAGRAAEVTCSVMSSAATEFWQGDLRASQMGRIALFGTLEPRPGPMYRIQLHERKTIVRAAARNVEDALSCVRRWLVGNTLQELHAELPELGWQITALLRHGVGFDNVELIGDGSRCRAWLYGDGGACSISTKLDALDDCTFYLGLEPIAHVAALADPYTIAQLWLHDRPRVRVLAEIVRGLVIEPDADLLESDPAQWSWRRLRARAPLSLHDLIDALASSPAASAFYAYEDGDALQLSASSHAPWAIEGLPRITRDTSIAAVDALLAAAPHCPFYGTGRRIERDRLEAALRERGSELRPKLIQRALEPRVVVAATGKYSGNVEELKHTPAQRWCHVAGTTVELGSSHGWVPCDSLDDIADVVIRYLDDWAQPESLVRN